MIPVNRPRYYLLLSVWPVTFAAYLMASAVYGSGGDRHPLADTWFDGLATVAILVLLVSAIRPRSLMLRMLGGLGVIGVTLARATWFFDPNFVAEQRLLAMSVYALAVVSALGWVMVADFAVVSLKVRSNAE